MKGMEETYQAMDYNGHELAVVITTLLVLTCLTVSLRVYVRIGITKVFELDDWLMVASQVLFTTSCTFILIGLQCGIGRHNVDLSTEGQIKALKVPQYQVLSTFTYIASMTTIKMSIAVFLLRLASKRIYVWTIWLSIVVVIVWSIIILFYDIFQCVPVAAQWNFNIPNAKCVTGPSFAAAAYSISVMTIVTDWLYALLPIPMIWGVKMTMKTKLTVVIILGLGIFASLATIIRLKYIMVLEEIDDILYSGTKATVWTLVEPGVAIIAASLFTIRPLLRFLHPSLDSHQSARLVAAAAPPLSLRSDVKAGNWNATVEGGVEKETDLEKGRKSFNVMEMAKGGRRSAMGSYRTKTGSEEWILRSENGNASCNESGITRTVDVRVESKTEMRKEDEV